MKRILTVLMLISACSTSATTYPYLGCDWFIPSDYKKISDNEYRMFPESGETIRSFSSLQFSTVTPAHLDTYIEMNQQPDTEVMAFSHSDSNGLSLKSLFINRKTRLGDTLSSDILLISKDGLAVSMLDVTQPDSFHITSACLPAQVIEQHYAVQKQLSQGIRQFLSTEHGLDILVPVQKGD